MEKNEIRQAVVAFVGKLFRFVDLKSTPTKVRAGLYTIVTVRLKTLERCVDFELRHTIKVGQVDVAIRVGVIQDHATFRYVRNTPRLHNPHLSQQPVPETYVGPFGPKVHQETSELKDSDGIWQRFQGNIFDCIGSELAPP